MKQFGQFMDIKISGKFMVVLTQDHNELKTADMILYRPDPFFFVPSTPKQAYVLLIFINL